jgi:hypothetical protein
MHLIELKAKMIFAQKIFETWYFKIPQDDDEIEYARISLEEFIIELLRQISPLIKAKIFFD